MPGGLKHDLAVAQRESAATPSPLAGLPSSYKTRKLAKMDI